MIEKKEFISYFDSTIKPMIIKYHQEQKSFKKTFAKTMFILYAAFIFAMFVLAVIFDSFVLSVGLFFIFVLVIFYFLKNEEIRIVFSNTVLSKKKKKEIMDNIIPKFLPGFSYSIEDTLTHETFQKYRIISPEVYHIFFVDDSIVKKVGDKKIRISNCHLYEKVNHGGTIDIEPFFSGLFIEIPIPVRDDFFVSITENRYQPKHFFNFGKDAEEVVLPHPFFEKKYRVRTNDIITAHKIFQPRNIEGLVKILQSGKKMNISISNGYLLIFSDFHRNMFEVFRGLDSVAEVMWEDLAFVSDIINAVHDIFD